MRFWEMIDRYFQRKSIQRQLKRHESIRDKKLRSLGYLDYVCKTQQEKISLAEFIIGKAEKEDLEIVHLKDQLAKLNTP